VSITRPMLFSGQMVRALLAGTKTQTRRVVKEPLWATPFTLHLFDGEPWAQDPFRGDRNVPCHYGKPGDELWVREACRAEELSDGQDGTRYRADAVFRSIENSREAADAWIDLKAYGKSKRHDGHLAGPWVPSIHMPRWASRINLQITGVRVERLQDISEADALAEGISSVRTPEWDACHFPVWHREFEQVRATGAKPPLGPMPSQAYAALWDEINGPGAWALNPWVWVVEFKRVQP